MCRGVPACVLHTTEVNHALDHFMFQFTRESSNQFLTTDSFLLHTRPLTTCPVHHKISVVVDQMKATP